MNDRQRLEAIISVVCKYLPPDGIPINDAMSEIISYVDPLPPPQREWVGLTDEEIDVLDEATWDEDHKTWGIHDFARAIERALKEKNNGT